MKNVLVDQVKSTKNVVENLNNDKNGYKIDMSKDIKNISRQFPQVIAPYCLALEKSVGAIIFHRKYGEVKFLLIQYPHGHWEFARGHMEENETELETMYREIEEETGLKKESLKKIGDFREKIKFSYIAKGAESEERKKQKRCLAIRKTVVFYLLESSEDKISLSHEHTNYEWVSGEEAMKRLTFDNSKRIMKIAIEKISS